MKRCTGCKHLVNRRLCKAQDGPWTWEENPYTGRLEWKTQSPHGVFRPTVKTMRAPGAACGPDAVLYQLPWWRKILTRGGGK